MVFIHNSSLKTLLLIKNRIVLIYNYAKRNHAA